MADTQNTRAYEREHEDALDPIEPREGDIYTGRTGHRQIFKDGHWEELPSCFNDIAVTVDAGLMMISCDQHDSVIGRDFTILTGELLKFVVAEHEKAMVK
jgi:hypothetical protein